MRISHIAMYVRDLEVVKEFYIRFFGAKAGELYHNPKTGLKSYFLSFDEGTRLELMNLPEMQDQKKVEPEPELSVESLLESTKESADTLQDIGFNEKSETRVLIEKFVEENPEAAASLLRNWLNEEWE